MSAPIKNIRREYMTIYVADETRVDGCRSISFNGVQVEIQGTKDVYYLNMTDGTMYAYRAKHDKWLKGCVMVRDQDEYMHVYAIIGRILLTISETWHARLEREYNERHSA